MARYVIVHNPQNRPIVYERVPVGDRIEYTPVEADVIITSEPKPPGKGNVVAVLIGFGLGILKDVVIDNIKDLAKPIATAVVQLFIG